MSGANYCYSDTRSIQTDATGIISANATVDGSNGYGSVLAEIFVDGAECAVSRSIDSGGAYTHANASCSAQPGSGIHSVLTVACSYGSSGIANFFGASFGIQ